MSPAAVIDESTFRRLYRIGGAPFVEDMIMLFRDLAPPAAQGIVAAHAAADANEVRRAAHKLKSSAGNLGACTVQSIAEALESHGSRGDLAAAAPLAERLPAAVDEALAHLVALHAQETAA